MGTGRPTTFEKTARLAQIFDHKMSHYLIGIMVTAYYKDMFKRVETKFYKQKQKKLRRKKTWIPWVVKGLFKFRFV